tara:strand:+ start:5066 stop:6334 length:1269 start_codon:yes stop_codon:yes gene_type:complete
MKVLVVPCGTEIGLEINRSLKGVKNLKLLGLNSISDFSSVVYDNFYEGAPFVDSPNFINYLREFVSENQVTHIIPAHDSAALLISKHAQDFGAGVTVVSSNYETNNICRSKKLTYNTLKSIICVPHCFSALNEVTSANFPVFVKPDIGQGSKGARKVTSYEELAQVDFDSNVVTEYLPGDEFTVDCFTDQNGKLLYTGPRKRNRIQNGIAVSTVTISNRNNEFREISEKINSSISFKGAWFFQVKENSAGNLVLLEVATRIAGSMSTNRVKGVNFTELSLYIHNGVNVTVNPNSYDVHLERSLSNKYKLNIDYKHVYVDFDDCLIIDGKVNEELVAFLFKAINDGCRIYLVTRHENDLTKSLEKYRLAGLFDEIFHITDKSPKSEVMHHKDAIFIDDSFAERDEVLKCGIPCFSVDCVEALI